MRPLALDVFPTRSSEFLRRWPWRRTRAAGRALAAKYQVNTCLKPRSLVCGILAFD